MDRGDQAVFVAADVEHGHDSFTPHGHGVRVPIDAPHVLEVVPFRLPNDALPFSQRLGCIGKLASRFSEAFARNDPHFAFQLSTGAIPFSLKQPDTAATASMPARVAVAAM